MYELARALADHDLATLRIIGEWYELDLTGRQKPSCIKELVTALSELDLSAELTFLPPEESAALLDIAKGGGRLPVALFERNHGIVRQMGPGRMEREEPWLDPVSAAEALWYRGFIYRAFDDSDDNDLEEFYYLPTELSGQISVPNTEVEIVENEFDVSLNPVPEPERFHESTTDAVDDLTAMLAAAQIEPLVESQLSRYDRYMLDSEPDRSSLLYTLAWELQLLRPTDLGAKPTRGVVSWLNQGREVRLRELADAWRKSTWNELFHTPGIVCEGGSWENDPVLARSALLNAVPRDPNWYRLADVLNIIKSDNADFQRPGGNYDAWYIRDQLSGEYLAGFRSWEYVEGRQLAFTLSGPLVWLGLAKIALFRSPEQIIYRLTARALDWLEDRPVDGGSYSIPIVVQDDATVLVPFNADSYHRFQVARIAEAESPIPGKPFRYRLTPSSLERARKQGIEPKRLLRFLADASGRPIPTSTKRAIERWAENGTEGRLDNMVVLRVRDSEILQKLRANPKTRPYIAEALGELSVSVRLDEWEQLCKAAAQLGLLLDYRPPLSLEPSVNSNLAG